MQAGLLNPATARPARLIWKAEESIQLAFDLISEIQKSTTRKIWEPTGVFRPAIRDQLLRSFKKAFFENEWPHDDWASWYDANTVTKEDFSSPFPGLFLRYGATVFGHVFIEAAIKHFESYNQISGIFNQVAQKFLIHRPGFISSENLERDGKNIHLDHVIWANGYNILEHSLWNKLPLHPIKGQLALIKNQKSLPYALSASGYVCNGAESNTLVVGSTYEHHFSDADVNDDALPKLINTFTELTGRDFSSFRDVELWAGIRLGSKDRSPIVGQHRDKPLHYVLSAFGSKGLAYSPICAKQLLDHFMEGSEIPPNINVARFY